jgi:hypothetical protein
VARVPQDARSRSNTRTLAPMTRSSKPLSRSSMSSLSRPSRRSTCSRLMAMSSTSLHQRVCRSSLPQICRKWPRLWPPQFKLLNPHVGTARSRNKLTEQTVHAAVPANTFAIYGNGEDKELTELVPGILNQLGPDSLASLRKLAESYQSMQKKEGEAGNEDDEDIPDLVAGETFDEKVDVE